ncbi:hypothetical protein [Saccharothrix texasensis]|uniref:Uncharacterized protein n=1 Tax=Saccharothrix texasensis TaxID=103734 RepID=A0A3N1H2T3_9PSEU|nr:hypothetical protein [Saccharothrix texasensis]ROP36853.1 hypothetical protein EDD40_2132 [Saccharothrix texasensis]
MARRSTRSRELSATAGLVRLSTPDAIVRRRYEPAARDAVPAARLGARDDLAGPPHRAT